MKIKIGTIVDDALLAGAKQRAAVEKRALSGLIEDALRSLEKFAFHGGLLPPEEIYKILEEDALTP